MVWRRCVRNFMRLRRWERLQKCKTQFFSKKTRFFGVFLGGRHNFEKRRKTSPRELYEECVYEISWGCADGKDFKNSKHFERWKNRWKHLERWNQKKRKGKENFLAPNGVFEIGISPEPIGIFRRGKRQRVAYVRDFSAAKLQLSDSCENIAGDWQNLALIRFSAVM